MTAHHMTHEEEKAFQTEFERLYPKQFIATHRQAEETVLPHMRRGYMLGLSVERDRCAALIDDSAEVAKEESLYGEIVCLELCKLAAKILQGWK